MSTGIPGLDEILHGGLIAGRNILISGPCGSGKTTLAAQFLHAGVQRQQPGLYVTLEESKAKLYTDMKLLGIDFHAMEQTGNFMLIGGPLAQVTQHMDKVSATSEHLLTEIQEVIAEHNVKRVVIDSVNLFTMLHENDGERRKALAMLCSHLSEAGVTALLLTETKEGSFDLSAHGIEEFIADGVIALYNIRQGKRFVLGVVVRKMRGTDHDREIRQFRITNTGIVVYPNEIMFTDV